MSSASMTKKITEYHDRLAQAVAPLRGQEVSLSDIREAYAAAFPDSPEDLEWVMGTDHSRNHSNGGPCECAQTDRALFECLGRNRYSVL
jgi:hypothetical protein